MGLAFWQSLMQAALGQLFLRRFLCLEVFAAETHPFGQVLLG
jgi:hypothetical protein